MTTYILRRLLYALPVLAVSSFLIFTFVATTTRSWFRDAEPFRDQWYTGNNGIVTRRPIGFALARDMGGEYSYAGSANGNGFQQATALPSSIATNGGTFCQHPSRARRQRGAKAQPAPRAPGGGTTPGIVASLSPLRNRRGAAARRPAV